MFRTPKSLFRVLAFAEVVTWALLISALIARAVGAPSIVVTIGGAIHGFVFLAYGATAILVSLNQRLRVRDALIAIISAVVPFATIPTERWLVKRGKLEGDWRLEATDDTRDQRWYDKAMRFFLRKPWLLGALIAVAVIALYVVLLIAGPPVPKS